MGERDLTIGLAWHSVNSDNLGVGALTVSHLAILDDAASEAGVTPHYLAIGALDPRTPYVVRPDLEMRGLRLKDFIAPIGGLHAAMRRCDMVFDIGAGDSFADIYGPKRALMMLGVKFMAIGVGRPLILAPQTIGPFDGGWMRPLARAAMARSKLVATRDGLSSALVEALEVDAPMLEATDVALRLPYDPPRPRFEGPVRVGLNVSGLLFHGGYSRANMFGLAVDYAELARTLCARFSADPDVELHLIGHVVSERLEVEDDHRVCVALGKEFPGAVVAPAFGHPSEAKSYIAGMDFFMGARMHACIAALSSGVATLPMAYSRKFAGMFGTLGYPHLVDCKADDRAAIMAKVERAFAGRASLAGEAARSLEAGLARLALYQRRAAEIMTEVADAKAARR